VYVISKVIVLEYAIVSVSVIDNMTYPITSSVVLPQKLKNTTRDVLIDDREQKPLLFVNSRKKRLKYGDYTICGYEDCVAVERKSIDDAASSVSGPDRAKFEQRIIEAKKALKTYIIVIEANFSDLIDPNNYHSKISPECLVGTLLKWQVKYDVQIVFAGDRQHCGVVVKNLLDGWLLYNVLVKR
jgi:ERCC4-type nuclease